MVGEGAGLECLVAVVVVVVAELAVELAVVEKHCVEALAASYLHDWPDFEVAVVEEPHLSMPLEVVLVAVAIHWVPSLLV